MKSGCVLVLAIILSFSIQTKQDDITSYKSCADDSDCLENSFCVGNDANTRGKCQCKIGYDMLIRNGTFYACLKPANYSGPCTYSVECTQNLGTLGFCNEQTKTCTCNEGSHVYPKDNKCYKTIKLHEICQTSPECLLKDGSFAFCKDGTCDCDYGYVPTENSDECLVSKRLGEICSSDSDCTTIAHAYCGQTCVCRQGYSVCKHGTMCLKDATNIGDACREDIQCAKYIKNAYCSPNKTCACLDSRHFYLSECYKSVQIGDICDKDEECIYTDELKNIVECKSGVCTCKYQQTNDRLGCSSSQIMYLCSGLLLIFANILHLSFKFM